jgi:hypothetical protein
MLSVRCSREITEVVKRIVFWTLKESAVGRTAFGKIGTATI